MGTKTCSMYINEKHIEDFYKSIQNVKNVLVKDAQNVFYETKDEMSNTQKICYEKNRYKLLQRQNDR